MKKPLPFQKKVIASLAALRAAEVFYEARARKAGLEVDVSLSETGDDTCYYIGITHPLRVFMGMNGRRNLTHTGALTVEDFDAKIADAAEAYRRKN